MAERAFSYRRGEEVAEAFARHGVEYLFIGKAGAVFHGFPDTTQDVDIFPAKSRENGARIVAALRDLDFPVEPQMEKEILAGKAFVQIRSGPFNLDLVFAPDRVESFEDAKRRMVRIGGKFPVASLEDIIRSKRAANRPRDRETLPRLEAFAEFLKRGGRPSP
ncbi:MAG: hypothetical protein L0323_06940 [Planctomycetes bacterium]|nr:hypothetical protein [Planctomycetota bacterium]